MPNLPNNLPDIEAAIREAIRVRIDDLADSGQVYGRERFADSFADYLNLVTILDGNGETVIRAVFVTFRSVEPVFENGAGTTPQNLNYRIEILYQFEDVRKNGTNSSDDFNKLVMRIVEAFKKDDGLGYDNMSFSPPTTAEDATVEPFDKALIHHIVLSLKTEILFC
jgi:hypothetical protein